MEILDSDNDLRALLLKQSGREVYIVSAFASSTDGLIANLRVRNRVELIVGTMNYFTAPEFIQSVRDQPRGREGFWVDFRGPSSIHWKLYLISPDTVVVGSANLTDKGVSMRGETSVLIRDKGLYENYRTRVAALQADPNVVPATSKAFTRRLAEYGARHQRNQAGRQATGADRPTGKNRVPTLAQWLEDEANQSIVAFLWEDRVEERYVKEAKKLVNSLREAEGKAPSTSGRNPYIDLFTMRLDPDEKSSFRSGDVALCASIRGGHIGFHKLHIVKRVGRTDVMIELRREPDSFPFEITPSIKEAIKQYIKKNHEHGHAVVFRRKLLQSFAAA